MALDQSSLSPKERGVGLAKYCLQRVASHAWLDLHPRFAALHDHLSRRTPPGRLPGRQHFEPMSLGGLLPFIMLIDVLQLGARVEFKPRVVGTEFVAALGREITGLELHDAFRTGNALPAIEACEGAVEEACPRHCRISNPGDDRDFMLLDWAIFPLARDGATVDQLLVVFANVASAGRVTG
jgi:hypothetical protein